MKRNLALLLVIIMTIGCVAGCSAKDTTTPEVTSTTTTTEKSAETKKADVQELLGPGNVVIKSVYQNVSFDPNKDLMAGLIEKATGYKAEYFNIAG